MIAVRPYTHTDHYWRVYFDTNEAIVRVCTEAGWPAPATPRVHRNMPGWHAARRRALLAANVGGHPAVPSPRAWRKSRVRRDPRLRRAQAAVDAVKTLPAAALPAHLRGPVGNAALRKGGFASSSPTCTVRWTSHVVTPNSLAWLRASFASFRELSKTVADIAFLRAERAKPRLANGAIRQGPSAGQLPDADYAARGASLDNHRTAKAD